MNLQSSSTNCFGATPLAELLHTVPDYANSAREMVRLFNSAYNVGISQEEAAKLAGELIYADQTVNRLTDLDHFPGLVAQRVEGHKLTFMLSWSRFGKARVKIRFNHSGGRYQLIDWGWAN